MNEQMIRQWWDVFKHNGDLTEIRILDGKKTYSGYYKNIDNIIRDIKNHQDANIYFTLNCIDEGCYGRTQNERLVLNPKVTTSDADIIGRNIIMIDIDPKRKADTNSTDEELERAHMKAIEVYHFLKDSGFYEPIIAISANGYHIDIPVAMKATEENTQLVKRFLASLAMMFTDEYSDIDLKVFNNSRICKLYGTKSNKGADIADRPKRYSKLVKVPHEIKINNNEYIKKIADMYPEEPKPDRQNNYSTEKFDLESFIKKHNIEVTKVEKVSGGTKYILDHCLFNDSHRGKDAMFFQRDNGAIAYVCLHSSCANHTWQEVRKIYEPNAYEKKEYNNRVYNPRSFTPQIREYKEQEKDEEKGNVWQTMGEIEDEDRSKIVSIPSGITQYDKECCGFDIPSLSVWSGSNGSAKSTLLNQIAINAINKGFKVAMYSGELKNKKLKRWYLYQAAGKAYNVKSQYNDNDYYTPKNIKDKIVSWMADKFYNYNTKYSHNIEQICKEIECLAKETKIDMIFMDNLSSLDIDDLSGTINEQQKTAIKMLLRLSDKLNVAMHLVVHPRKSSSFLRKDDISGSKTITDLADNVFIVHRWNLDTQKAAQEFLPAMVYKDLCDSQATNLVEVIKHREFGEAEGHIYKLYFETESKRLKNSVAEHIVYGWQENGVQQSIALPQEEPNPFLESSESCPF